MILGFAYGKESVPVQYLGTVSGAINIGNMIGPTLLQPGIGRILEQHWTGAMANGARVYGVEAFQAAFLLSVGWTLLSCVLSSLTRETDAAKQRRRNQCEEGHPSSDVRCYRTLRIIPLRRACLRQSGGSPTSLCM